MKHKTVRFDVGELSDGIIRSLVEEKKKMEEMLKVANQIATSHLEHIAKSRDAGMWLVDHSMNVACEKFVEEYKNLYNYNKRIKEIVLD